MATDASPPEALFRLLAWLSPGYPVGAFSYSHGLENAVEEGLVADATAAEAWIGDVLRHGGARNDGVLLACTHRAVAERAWADLAAAAETAAAFAATAELALETSAQGAAFLRATADAWPCDAIVRLAEAWQGPVAYPVAVGTAAAGHGIMLEDALVAYLHAFAANLVSAAVRLIPLGQTDGLRILAAQEPIACETAISLHDAALEDLGGAALAVDIASMKHETQYTRLFRS